MDISENQTDRLERLTLTSYHKSISSLIYPSKLLKPNLSDAFHGSLNLRPLGRLEFIRASSNTSFMMKPTARRKYDEECLALHLQLSGESTYKHVYGTVACVPDTAVLVDRESITLTEQHCPGDAIVVKMPMTFLRHHIRDMDHLCWAKTDVRDGPAMILKNFILSILTNSGTMSGRDHVILSEVFTTLLNSTFRDTGNGFPSRAEKSDRLFALLVDEITSRIHDPSLNATQLSKALGISRTKLYNVTHIAGTTVERMIIESRLEWVAAALRNKRFLDMTITSLAFEAGFSELSHFSRRFKDRFGLSPRDYRLSNLN